MEIIRHRGIIMGQMENIRKIQDQLVEYGKLIKMMKKSDIQDFGFIVLQGSIICEQMLRVLIEEKGYYIEDNGMVRAQDQNIRGNMTPLGFVLFNKTFLPRQCTRFVQLIRTYRNQAAHVPGIDFETAIVFAKALDYFTLWFDDYLTTHKIIGAEDRKLFKSSLFSLEEALKKPPDSDISIEAILQKLAEQTELTRKLTIQVGHVEAQSDRIEHKVDKIYQQIKELAAQIGNYQSLVEKQVQKAHSNEEIDRILQAYTDECSERIVKQMHSKTEQTLYEQEERKLVISLGEKAWRKMEDASKTFLVSAKVMYNHLIMLDDIIDYSGVCVLVTKALEVEMKKRFYYIFLEYLDQNYHRDYSKYPTALLFQNRARLNPEKFTMGSIAFVLCYLENKYDSSIQKSNNKQKLLEYCKTKVFPGKTETEINNMITEYAKDVEKIRMSYRNPSAHTNELKKVNAEECFNYVLDVEKVLKNILDSFAF